MNQKHAFLIIGLTIIVGVAMMIWWKQDHVVSNLIDPKNATYVIEGESVTLSDGTNERPVVSGSATQMVTRYFGNDLVTDLNGDGRNDVVFILTQETGGSGIFYYIVAALATDEGYVGSEGYLLGDRVAPQSISESTESRHQRVIVATYADRAEGEPMSTPPSVGISVYLKLDQSTMQWGVVLPAFEGESHL